MTSEQFEEGFLRDLGAAVADGHAAISERYQTEVRRSAPQLVSELSAATKSGTAEYLLGQEPEWSDIQSGLAFEREYDAEVHAAAGGLLNNAGPNGTPLVITGTAGSGKSTSLMRLGLRLSAEGIPVFWIDEQSNIQPYKLRESILAIDGKVAVLVDDADLWGKTVTGWAREITNLREGVLFAAAVRSGKFDGLLDAPTTGVEPIELPMPPLSDGDIEGLIRVLDENNRLGVLKGKSHTERVDAFRAEAGAGRQLLVAMIQATSGKRFRDKVFEEFGQLPDIQKFLYAIVCLVHSQRYTIDREDIVVAAGSSDNETLNALESLVRRHIVVRENLHSNYRARHRVVADEVVNGMQFRDYAGSVLEGVCYAFANRIRPTLPRTARSWRRLIRFINHDYVLNLVQSQTAREIYGKLEGLLHWDYHYWLQRGSLEVEQGDLELATNFLNQARSMTSGSRPIETEYAYLVLKKAARDPTNLNAKDWFDEGWNILDGLIRDFGREDPYPYHILGSQGLAWSRTAYQPIVDKRLFLFRLVRIMNQATEHHPNDTGLKGLADAVKEDWLLTAVEDKK